MVWRGQSFLERFTQLLPDEQELQAAIAAMKKPFPENELYGMIVAAVNDAIEEAPAGSQQREELQAFRDEL
jgi:hypothetical protein